MNEAFLSVKGVHLSGQRSNLNLNWMFSTSLQRNFLRHSHVSWNPERKGMDTEDEVMAKKSIEYVINSLSEVEKENLKDLIRETLERNGIIKDNPEKALKVLRSFLEYVRLLQALEEEAVTLRKMREELQSIKYTMYLMAIPESKFHRA